MPNITNIFGSKKKFVLFTLLLFSVLQSLGQNSIKLQHRLKSDKTRILSLEEECIIKANGKKYNILYAPLTDSSIFIIQSHNTGRDTVYPDPIYGNVRDRSFAQYIYKTDTIEVLFSHIEWIKKPRFKNREWLTPFLYFGLVAAGGLVVAPIGAAINPDEASEFLVPEAILLAITVPPILIATSKIKHNLTKKMENSFTIIYYSVYTEKQ